MRVVAGKYRGRKLKSPSDLKIRPTSDRLRETLFNILHPRISVDTKFLDLCAGTGAIGIEALSRDAGFVTFVDVSRKACAIIEENLDNLGIPENQTEVFNDAAESFLTRNTKSAWDIVYYDPPYNADYAKILKFFANPDFKFLNESGIFIAEHAAKNILPDAVCELRRWRIVKQGDSCLSFYELE